MAPNSNAATASSGPGGTGTTVEFGIGSLLNGYWEDAAWYAAAKRFAEEVASGHHPSFLADSAADQLTVAFDQFRMTREKVAEHFMAMARCAMDEAFGNLFGLVMEFAMKADYRDQIKRFFAPSGPGSYRYDQLHILEKRVETLEQLANTARDKPKSDWTGEQAQLALQKLADLSLRVRKLEKSSA